MAQDETAGRVAAAREEAERALRRLRAKMDNVTLTSRADVAELLGELTAATGAVGGLYDITEGR